MNRKLVLVILLAGFACWLAIRSNSLPKPKRVGEFGKAEIEAEIKEVLKLKDVSLTEETGGKYAGTGIGQDGIKYKITITQSENKLTWESEDDKGAKIIGSKRWNRNIQ